MTLSYFNIYSSNVKVLTMVLRAYVNLHLNFRINLVMLTLSTLFTLIKMLGSLLTVSFLPVLVIRDGHEAIEAEVVKLVRIDVGKYSW